MTDPIISPQFFLYAWPQFPLCHSVTYVVNDVMDVHTVLGPLVPVVLVLYFASATRVLLLLLLSSGIFASAGMLKKLESVQNN